MAGEGVRLDLFGATPSPIGAICHAVNSAELMMTKLMSESGAKSHGMLRATHRHEVHIIQKHRHPVTSCGSPDVGHTDSHLALNEPDQIRNWL